MRLEQKPKRTADEHIGPMCPIGPIRAGPEDEFLSQLSLSKRKEP